jgi:uncharacterized UBP type Zn finger protein
MKRIKIVNISKVVTLVSGFDFAASCKKSDKQVIKKEETVRSFPKKLILQKRKFL